MYQLTEYKHLLGREINSFLDGKISFDELQENISKGDLKKVRDDEVIKSVWHALYQLDIDSTSSDKDYVNAIKASMKKISLALVSDDEKVEKYIDEYFNDPG